MSTAATNEDATNRSVTVFDGVTVGHWTNHEAKTGCTVLVFPDDNTAAAEVRGAAPGTREVALLAPGMTVRGCNAILLTGGSGLGLGSADGVVAELRAADIGYKTEFGTIPIVPTAVVFDLGMGDGDVYPTADDGASAYRAASGAPVADGPIGAGVGCSIAKWRGERMAGGLGNATASVGGITVGAIAVVNATGDLFSLEGEPLSGGPHAPGPPSHMAYAGENTTLVAIVTDVALSREDLGRLIVRAHDAMGVCIRPAHTRYDGDICFAVATGTRTDQPDVGLVDAAGEAAFAAVGRAIEHALTASPSSPEA